jgi:hypothetical protein
MLLSYKGVREYTRLDEASLGARSDSRVTHGGRSVGSQGSSSRSVDSQGSSSRGLMSQDGRRWSPGRLRNQESKVGQGSPSSACSSGCHDLTSDS